MEGKIVFVSDREIASRKIYIVNADGTGFRVVPTNTDFNEDPCFDPSGKRIIFVGDYKGKDGIFVFDLEQEKLEPILLEKPNNMYYRPRWGRNGEIFYIKEEWGSPNSQSAIYRYNSSTQKEEAIVEVRSAAKFSVSQDGRLLAYEKIYNPTKRYSDIWVLDLRTGKATNLTKGEGSNHHPAISPDGKKIAFVSDRDGGNEIYTMDIDGSNVKRITRNRWLDQYPAWSPDGKKLVYTSHRHGDIFGGAELFIMDLERMKEWQITKTVETKHVGILSYDIKASWAK